MELTSNTPDATRQKFPVKQIIYFVRQTQKARRRKNKERISGLHPSLSHTASHLASSHAVCMWRSPPTGTNIWREQRICCYSSVTLVAIFECICLLAKLNFLRDFFGYFCLRISSFTYVYKTKSNNHLLLFFSILSCTKKQIFDSCDKLQRNE